jgi:hypothetical protein
MVKTFTQLSGPHRRTVCVDENLFGVSCRLPFRACCVSVSYERREQTVTFTARLVAVKIRKPNTESPAAAARAATRSLVLGG